MEIVPPQLDLFIKVPNLLKLCQLLRNSKLNLLHDLICRTVRHTMVCPSISMNDMSVSFGDQPRLLAILARLGRNFRPRNEVGSVEGSRL